MKHDTILLHAIPGFIILIILEYLFFIKENKEHYKKDMLVSFAVGIGFAASAVLGKGTTMYLYTQVYNNRLFDLNNNLWWVWLLCFFADDLTYYLFHRISHKVRFFWASHSVHHSAEIFSFLATLRESWTSNITGIFLFWIWLPFIGLEPGLMLIMKSISVLYQFFIHTEGIKRLPRWVEFIFNTPSHHRVHHGCNLEYLDKNYGGILIIWDRLFGTFTGETCKPTYGLTKKINSHNPVRIAFYEWCNMVNDIKKSKRFSDIFNYIFNAPGWSNDGSSKTTNQLRKLNALTEKESYKSISLPDIRKLSFMLLFTVFGFTAVGQSIKLQYDVMDGKRSIGWMNIEKTDSVDQSLIKLQSETQKRFVTLFKMIEKQETLFYKGMMISSSVYRKINKDIKVDQRTMFKGNKYIIQKGEKEIYLNMSKICNNQLSLYFFEPLNTNFIYSDLTNCMVPVKKMTNGMYCLMLPDGSTNYYKYENGICNYIKIVRSLFTVEMKLKK